MKKLILLSILALTSCNNKAEIPNRMDIVQSGKSTAEITISFEFLNQLSNLCRGLLGNTPYPSPEAKEAAVSECVFNRIKDIGAPVDSINDFGNQYCGESANYAGLSQTEILQLQQTCDALGL